MALDAVVEARQAGRQPAHHRAAHRLRHLLGPRLGAFLNAYPDIVLEIANEDGFTDVVEGGFDAGIRLEESLEADMIAVSIGPRSRRRDCRARLFRAAIRNRASRAISSTTAASSAALPMAASIAGSSRRTAAN
jgi:hypothetical protein